MAATGGSVGGNTIELGVAVTGVSQAVSDLGKVKQANDAVGDGATVAGEKIKNAAQLAKEETKKLADETAAAARQAQLMQSKLSALAAGLGQVGSILGGDAGGVIGQVAQMTSAGVSLGSTFGPTGAVVGGLIGAAVPAFSALMNATSDAEEKMRQARETADNLANSFLEAARQARSLAAAQLEARAQEGLAQDQIGVRLASEESLYTQRNRAITESVRLQLAIANAEQTAATASTEFEGSRSRREQMDQRAAERIAAMRTDLEGMGSLLDATSVEIERRSAEARAAAEQAGQITTGQNGLNATNQEVTPARRGGGGAAARAEAERMRELAHATRAAAEAERERAEALLAQKTKIEQIRAEEQAQVEAIAATLAEIDARELEYARQIADATREKAEAQKELAQTAVEAAETFRSSWGGSIDDVVARWRDANSALADAGQAQMSTARLMEGAMTSAATSIADSVGGTMTSALQTAVGAWLDGSMSIAEAAEGMMKSVLKSLVIESIVQTVVEGARAIASFASLDIAGGVAHLGAAAAWAAVGVVAGSVGAATGSFGGAGAKGQATGAEAPRASAQDNQQGGGTTVINVYPGGFVTRDDVTAGVFEAINSGARNGLSFDAAAVGA